MINSFFGFEMGRRAMDYFRRGMETAGHNMANADVEGYSRQRVEASSTTPFTDPGLARPAIPGQIGTGVKIDAIKRLRDLFLDSQYREEISVQGYWQQVTAAVNQTEIYVNEPAGKGFQSSLDTFWTALQEVSKRPDSSSTRENLVQTTKSTVVFLQQLQTNYDQYRTALNKEIKLKVDEANDYIDQIAQLNEVISEVKNVGGNPNDLLDRRDLLTDKLCKIIDCSVGSPCIDEADGEFKIDLHGKLLVQGTKTRHLETVPMAGNQGFFDVQVEDNTFDHLSDPSVAGAVLEQRMAESVLTLEVQRTANEANWEVGKGNARLTGIQDPTAALGLRGSFALQVDTNGVQKTSAAFPAAGGNPAGTVLVAPPAAGATTEYRFRLAEDGFERVVTAQWDAGGATWRLNDNVDAAWVNAAGGHLNLTDLQGFVAARYGTSLTGSVNGAGTEWTLASNHRELLSITDIQGNLTAQLGLKNANPSVTIQVTEEDSLNTIANKINGAYASELAKKTPPELTTDPAGDPPDRPEEWLRCLIERDGANGAYYLKLQSDVAGEAQRINVLGGDDCGTGTGGSLYMARKLGFVNADDSTSVVTEARDACFTLEGKEYLSSSNAFRDARLITGDDGWSAGITDEVFAGLRLELKSVGTTQIQCRHHVQGGVLKGMLESRDDFILAQTDSFDEITFGLVSEMNALHFSGHGTGDFLMVTGTAFFDPVAVKYGSTRYLNLNEAISNHSGLIAAASDDGKGKAQGTGDTTSGDGSNALRMAQLKQAKVLNGRSADFNGYYESFIAELGATGQRAATMTKNQTALVSQINTQRQAVMGVNMDEEMMDIIKFQQSFNGAARYITTIDEMLDRIINGMGRVGL